jgi:hypothetical protein
MSVQANKIPSKYGNKCQKYIFTVTINSFIPEQFVVENFGECEKVFTLTWDKQYFEATTHDSTDKFQRSYEMKLSCTPLQLNEKLKTIPIVMNFMTESRSLGIVKIFMTKCFAAVTKCENFNEESEEMNLELTNKKSVSVRINAEFKIRKVTMKIVKRKKKNLKKKRKNELFTIKIKPTAKLIEKDEQQQQFIQQMKKKFANAYSYEFGDCYRIHKYPCPSTEMTLKVPHSVGWRHDKLKLGTQKWKPGRINKTVRVLMKHHLNPFPYDTINNTKVNRKNLSRFEFEVIDDDEIKPTLHVLKRNGEMSIEMRPLKDRSSLMTDENPYLNCAPLRFTLKKHPEEVKKDRARQIMKTRGYDKNCACENIQQCCCININQKRLMMEQLRFISCELNLKNDLKYEELNEAIDEPIDFEFTPPSINQLNGAMTRKKVDMSHIGKLND